MTEKIIEYVLGMLTSPISHRFSQGRLKDRQVFDRLINELSPDSSAIHLLEKHDMGGPFSRELMVSLDRACESWRRVSNEFQTKKIEQKKLAFTTKLSEFLKMYSQQSRIINGGFVSIGLKDYDDTVSARRKI